MALYYRSRRRKIFIFIIFPLVLLLIFSYFSSQIAPAFISISEDKIYSLSFNIINTIINEELAKIDTQNLIDYKYDTAGKITAVNANIGIMNQLNNTIGSRITQEISKLENIYIKIPLGSFINTHYLAAIGPEIPIKILPLNNVNTEYNTDFTSTGINQTRHRIFINVNYDFRVLSMLVTENSTIKIQIPIAETIIVGNVPTTYFDFEN